MAKTRAQQIKALESARDDAQESMNFVIERLRRLADCFEGETYPPEFERLRKGLSDCEEASREAREYCIRKLKEL